MQSAQFIAGLSFVTCFISSAVVAQEIPNGPRVQLSLDEQLFFVLTSDGFATAGIDIQSPTGSLVPLPPGDLSADPSPFDFALANSSNQITLALLGELTIDGSVKLNARWNPGGQRDVVYQYGDGPVPIGPFELAAADYDRCPDCLPQIGVGLTDDLRFRLTGVGQQLAKFSLDSRAGSLVPADSPTPFSAFGNSSPTKIDFEAGQSPVVLDGDVTLAVGWNDHIGGRDVRYQYEATADGLQGPFQLDINTYPPRPFIPGDLNAYVSATNQLVVTGAGHPLTRLSFGSESGSLVAATENGPFETLTSNTSDRITYSAPTRGSQVVVDGTLKLGAGWDPNGKRDVTFDYSIAGDARDAGLFQIPDANYLAEGANANSILPANQLPRFKLSLNEDAKLVLTSDGRSLQQLQLTSKSHAIVPGDSASPFDKSFSNDGSAIAYRSFGREVLIDGSVTLASGWNVEGEQDVTYSYFSRDGVGLGFKMPAREYASCLDCPVPRIGVSLNENQNFVLEGQGQQLTEFVITSPEQGALMPADGASPFASLGENTNQRIQFDASPDGPITVDGTVTLSAGWNIRERLQDVEISYKNADKDGVESFELPFGAYPTTPRYSSISVRVNDEYKLVLSGNGQPLTGLTFASSTGSLTPAETADPFQALVENTATSIEFSSPTSHVAIDGNVTLTAGWNPRTPKQIQYGYTLLERSKESVTRSVPSSRYPALPQYILSDDIGMTIDDDDNSLVISGSGFATLGIDIQSASGSLIEIPPGDSTADASPFQFVLKNTPNNVALGSLGETVTIDGSIKLGVKWDENGPGNDIQYFYGDGEKNEGPFDIHPNEYPRREIPDCFDCNVGAPPVVDPPASGPPPFDGDAFAEFDAQDLSTIFLDITDQQMLAIRGDGQSISQLIVGSPSAGLVTSDDEQGNTSSGPFESLSQVNSQTGQLFLFDSNSLVTLDGVLALDMGWREEFDGPREAYLNNLFTDVTAQVITPTGRLRELDFYRPIDPSSFELKLSETGEIILVGVGAVTGINLVSAAGNLVPAAPNDLAADAGSFSFFLANNDNQVTFGNLGASVDINGELNLGVGLNALDLASSDLVIEIGIGNEVIRIAAGDIILPEPSAQRMIILGVLLLPMLRRRSAEK